MSTSRPVIGNPEEHMWVTAQNVASNAGFSFDPACAMNLRGAIARGLSTQNVDIARYNSRIADSNTNVEILVRQMIRTALDADPQARVLHEWTLSGALSQLCPGLWPFC
jgi:hypothetical protein